MKENKGKIVEVRKWPEWLINALAWIMNLLFVIKLEWAYRKWLITNWIRNIKKDEIL